MAEKRAYRWFDVIVGLFVAVLIISNIISVKIVKVPLGFLRYLLPFVPRDFGPTFDGGTLLFPLSYIFNDILTEVYGYAHSRRAIWTGFASLALFSLFAWIVGVLPHAGGASQEAYRETLMFMPRVVLASMVAFFSGEFSNSVILSRMKILTGGKWLWTRTIGSTVVGELIDSVIFVLVAFAGIVSSGELISIIVSNYLFKTGYEVLATPLTYAIVRRLKRAENEDKFDHDVNYNPFRLE